MGSGNRMLQGRSGRNQFDITDDDMAELRRPVSHPSPKISIDTGATPKQIPLQNEMLEKLIHLTDAALAGDMVSIEAVRAIGEALLIGGGVEAMCRFQGALHDYAVDKYRAGSRGSAVGSFWEHIPEWANL